MRRIVSLLSALSLLGAGTFFAQQKDAKPKDAHRGKMVGGEGDRTKPR